MNRRFWRSLKIVTAVHISVVVLLLVGGMWQGCMRKKQPLVLPVALRIEVPAAILEVESPVLAPRPAPTPEPKPRPRAKPKIDVSKKKITRSPKVAKKRLSPEQLRKLEELIAAGAKMSATEVMPVDEEICLLRIKNALYNAWERRPSKTDVGESVTQVEIRFRKGGVVVGRTLSLSSGSRTMDASVMKAAGLVNKIEGLSREFLRRHNHRITVAFKVE